MIARPRPGRGDSARGLGWFGARLVADLEEWEPSRTERFGSSRLTLAAGEIAGKPLRFLPVCATNLGDPGLLRSSAPPALRFLPALS